MRCISSIKKPSIKSMMRSQKGVSVVFFAITLTVITVFIALAVDIGLVAFERSKLSAALDAAALAGAQELVANSTNTENMIRDYVAKNAGTIKEVDVAVDTTNKLVQVRGVKTVPYAFARIFNLQQEDISLSAKAKVENIKSLKGARPLAIVNQTFTYGQLYTLKEGAGDGTTGNYAAISLGDTGSSVYRDNLLNGYAGTISVGDKILTETGNIAGYTQTCVQQLINSCNHSPACTYTYYNKTCSRIIFVPIVNTLEVSGRKYVEVLGFGTFFLEGTENKGGHTDVIGRFITYHANGETSGEVNDYGTYGIRLVK